MFISLATENNIPYPLYCAYYAKDDEGESERRKGNTKANTHDKYLIGLRWKMLEIVPCTEERTKTVNRNETYCYTPQAVFEPIL